MSDFQDLTEPDGRVQTALGIPTNSVYFRGFLVDADTDSFIVKEWNGAEKIYFNAGIAVNDQGVILINPNVPTGGGNLVTNGNFEDGTNGWVAAFGTLSIGVSPDPQLIVTTTSGVDAWARPAVPITTQIGVEYTFKCALTQVVANHGKVELGSTLDGSDYWFTTNQQNPVQLEHTFTATGTELYIQLQASPDGGALDDYTGWDNVSVFEGGSGTTGGTPTDSGMTVDSNGILFASDVGAIDVIHQALGLENSTISGILQITTGAASTPPADPTNLVATPVPDKAEISIVWDDNATNEAGYRLERNTTGAGGPWANQITLPAGSDSYIDDFNIVSNTTYWYRVFAFNGAGDSNPSNVDSAIVGEVSDRRVTQNADVRITQAGDNRVVVL
jgi:hypothetical protein